MADLPLISVVIPVYNDPDRLRACLAGLACQDDPAYEVVVADDASTIDHAAICREFGARYVRLEANGGPGVARGAGIREAKGEIFAFTDSDCVAPPDWLKRIRANLSEPGVVATAGTYQKDLSGTFIAAQRFLEARFHHLRERRFVSSFIGANCAVRRDALEKAGGFPPLRLSEDLLLGYRLRQNGHGVLWDYDLAVAQYFRRTIRAYFQQQRRWSRGVLMVHLDHPGTVRMEWSAKRSGIPAQLACHALFLVAAPLCAALPALWPLPAACALGTLAVQGPYLRWVARERSFLFAVGTYFSAWWIRNTAWWIGIVEALLSRPGKILPLAAYLASTPRPAPLARASAGR